jgi:hypothetical protein
VGGGRALVLLTAALLLPRPASGRPAAAPPPADLGPADAARPWQPADAAAGEGTAPDASFHGLLPLDPVRLHLDRGGFAEGALGGVDRERGVVVLLEPGRALEVGLELISAVTALRPDAARRDEAGALRPEPVPASSPSQVRYAVRPTWRSHLGLALSFVVPGTGQFIQEENRRVGWIFLSAWTFVVSAGVLALVVPSPPPTEERIAIAASFFAVGVGFNVTAAIHAFQQGRRRVPVPARRAGGMGAIP